MLFTDRFIKVPVKECPVDDVDIPGVERELFDNWEKIDPDDIVSYRPCLDKEGNREENKVNLFMRNQDPFPVYWSVKEFEQRMNDFCIRRENGYLQKEK